MICTFPYERLLVLFLAFFGFPPVLFPFFGVSSSRKSSAATRLPLRFDAGYNGNQLTYASLTKEVLTASSLSIAASTTRISSASTASDNFSACASCAILNRLDRPTSETSSTGAGVLARLLSVITSSTVSAARRCARGIAAAMNRPAAATSTLFAPSETG